MVLTEKDSSELRKICTTLTHLEIDEIMEFARGVKGMHDERR